MVWIIVEFIVFVIAVIVTVAFYFEKPDDLKRLYLILSVVFLGIGVARRSIVNASEKKKHKFFIQLAKFIEKGNELNSRKIETPLPEEDLNKWIKEISSYLNENDKEHFVTRFNDFNGMVFHGDGSDKSNYQRNLSGRVRRLHEFMKESNV